MMAQGWIFLSAFSSVFYAIWLNEILVVESRNFADVEGTVKFSLSSRKNRTGHVIIRFTMDESSMDLPDNWNLNVEHRFTKHNGVKSVYLEGIFTAPPDLPKDYELFPGVGYYKFHNETAPNFDEANDTCFQEGGHLAIANSPEEASVFIRLWDRYASTPNYDYWSAYLGFHDQIKEGEFKTIFGQDINSTGYTKWSIEQPDNFENDENCGAITRLGLLNDVSCGLALPFICEYDLSS